MAFYFVVKLQAHGSVLSFEMRALPESPLGKERGGVWNFHRQGSGAGRKSGTENPSLGSARPF